MAFAVGKAYPILLRMSEKVPEAKKLLDDLANISQEDYSQRFGALLKQNPSYDSESPEPVKEASIDVKSAKPSKIDTYKPGVIGRHEDWVVENAPKLVEDIGTDEDFLKDVDENFDKYWTKIVEGEMFAFNKQALRQNNFMKHLMKDKYKAPEIVSREEFLKLASDENNVVLFRGLQSGVDKSGKQIPLTEIISNQIYGKEPFYPVWGAIGSGVYTTTAIEEAETYSQDYEGILRFVGKRDDLKLIEYEDLKLLSDMTEKMLLAKYPSDERVKKFVALKNQSKDSVLSVMLGFDGVYLMNRKQTSKIDKKSRSRNVIAIHNFEKFKTYDANKEGNTYRDFANDFEMLKDRKNVYDKQW